MAHARDQRIYEFGNFRIDVDHRMLYHQGSEIPLVPKAVETLLALIDRRGKIVSKDELLDAVWPDTVVEESSLFVYLSVLRKTLGMLEDGRPYIETLRRRGYRFNGDVRLVVESLEDNNHQPSSDQLEQSRANTESQAALLQEEKNWNQNATESAKIISRSPLLPDLVPVESLPDLTPSTHKLTHDEKPWSGREEPFKAAHPKVRGEGVSNDITPSRPRQTWRRSRLMILAGVIIAVLGVSIYYLWERKVPPTLPPRIVAVLPFKPQVVENRDEALESGMTEDLITRLGNIKGIIVRSPTSVRKYGGMDQDPLAAGRELQVDLLLDGSIQRSNDQVRVTVRLLRVDSGEQLWAAPFDEKFTNIFAVQDAISARVVDALALHLTGDEEKQLTKRDTNNAAAYDHYQKGRLHVLKLTPKEIQKGLEFFEQAVKLDPAYAKAYAGIAYVYETLPITSDADPKLAFPKAKEAVKKALDLDDSLAEAHAILGWINFWFDWDWLASEREFRRAINLDPNNSDARRGYAQLLANTGRHDEALREIEKARELDPVSLITNTLQAQFLHWAGRDAEAVQKFEKIFDELDSNFWVAHVNLAYVLIHEKEYQLALTELTKAQQQSGGNTQAISLKGYVLTLSGDRKRARNVLEELRRLSEKQYVPPYNLAVVHHGLGESEETFAWLEKAFEERDVLLTFLAVDRKWDTLRSDPRFVSLLERMKLR